MKISLETITPDRASQLLSGNVDNRPLNKNHVIFLADQIKNGTWQVTGDPIKIGSDDRVIDGQHRLTAIVKAGIPVEVFLATSVPDEVFTVLDTGKQRTARDVLGIAKLKSPSDQAAVARLYMMYRDGQTRAKTRAYSNEEVLDFCRQNDVLSHVNLGKNYAKQGAMLLSTIISVCSFILHQVDSKMAPEFLDQLCLGINVKPNTAMQLLREKITKATIGSYPIPRWELIAVVIKAWNLERQQAKLPSILIYNPIREEFPKAI